MANEIVNNPQYKNWLIELKTQFSQTQIQATIKVNSALLTFYWQLGSEIVAKQQSTFWGDGVLTQLSRDLCIAFPDIKGFSKRNLELIRQWYNFWSSYSIKGTIAKQPVSQLFQIPWSHNLKIVAMCQSHEEALFYVKGTQKFGWSRNVLTHQIESQLWQRDGQSLNNFEQTLPSTQSDLAQQTLKDPYIFDFLSLTPEHSERELEHALVKHITQFLLELGSGFAYMGKQVSLEVGEREFFLDLLFYHTKLHCYVVIELKTGSFEPEHAGKLNFYIKAVDQQLRKQGDEATIGILLCKDKDKLVAEYALSDIKKPIGVSEYKLTQSLPDDLKSSLPSIEKLESELAADVFSALDN